MSADPAIRALVAELERAAATRTMSVRIDDGEQLIDVSVAPGERWSVVTRTTEWSGRPGAVDSWTLNPAGAMPRTRVEPEGWLAPVVGMIWPHKLPIWGRVGDVFAPRVVIEGTGGHAMIPLEPMGGDTVGGFAVDPGATAEVDLNRGIVTLLELPRATWTLVEVTPTRG